MSTEKKMCPGCPFDCFSDLTDQFYNYGCLPGPHEIMQEMHKTGKNWACHDDPKKICKGVLNFVERMKEPLEQHIKQRYPYIPNKIDLKKPLLLQEGIHK